jgi:hypothetical protein
MSTLANITSLNLSLQTGGAALAIKAVKSVAKPARTVYVFGTADDVAPNFTTVSGALTYANSLTPIVTEPVVIRTFTKSDGTPYTLAGLSSWTTYANQYIYFVSDFVRLNETTTLPTTLPAGQQVWYIDPNGVETLWVGREDGSAQLVGGALVGTFTPIFTVADAGTITASTTLNYSRLGNIVRIYGGCTISTDEPIGTVSITNIPFPAVVSAIGIYRVGTLETTTGLTNTSYACNTTSDSIQLGDSASLDSQSVFFIDIAYGA